MKKFIALAFVMLLTGCAGTEFHTRQMERHGFIKYHQVDGQNYDYKITIQNVDEIGIDLDKQEDRLEQISLLIGDHCSKIEIVSESQVNRGIYLLTKKPKINYVMNVKCIN